MHFDLAHALVTVALIFGVTWGMRRAGLADTGRFDWRLVVAITVVVFLLNLLWPAQP